MAFLRAEWKILGYFAVIVALLLDLWAAAASLLIGRSQYLFL
jgi:hypothetical protein